MAGIAKATLSNSHTDWDGLVANYDRIRDSIERVVPGFERFNQRVRQPGGFELPNPIRERVFATPSGKAQFTVNALPRLRLEPGQFLMMTIRSHDQYNTTIYGLEDRYRGVHHGRRVILLNEEDCREAGLPAATSWISPATFAASCARRRVLRCTRIRFRGAVPPLISRRPTY